MLLTRHSTPEGPRWARDGRWLPADFSLAALLRHRGTAVPEIVAALPDGDQASGRLLAPLEDTQEVWASGVTYLSSRLGREAESQSKDVYQKVYDADRPELFFKAPGWRAVDPEAPLRIRRDSSWDVPEPELTLVLTSAGEIVGYTAGNDMSSRSIEGENPLYLPQAKVYDGSCGIGPGILLASAEELLDLPIEIEIRRGAHVVFAGETRTSLIKRKLEDLAGFLVRELSFPHGVLLMTGTGIVPGEDVTLRPGDRVRLSIGELVLANPVAS
ncbi:MAG: fumarylacetoacetate hydrolase family protein [Opitutales bacterium]